jgi:hypothetical protein
MIEHATPEPWGPASEPDAAEEARDDGIRKLSLDEQMQLAEAIREAERLVALGIARLSAPESSANDIEGQ